MRSVLAWFSPNDSLLVDQTAVIRIVNYCESSVTLEVTTSPDASPATLTVGLEWAIVVGVLEARYSGMAVNEKCQPPRLAGIEFRDTGAVDLRHHTFKGMPVAGARPMGRNQISG